MAQNFYKDTPVQDLPGVKAWCVPILEGEGIETAHDLLHQFPSKYIDRSRMYKIKEINGASQYIQVSGKITHMAITGTGRGQRLTAKFFDGESYMDLVWFQAIDYIVRTYHENVTYIVFGKPTIFGNKVQLAHPEIDTPTSIMKKKVMGVQQSHYSIPEKMKRKKFTSATMRSIIVEELEGTVKRNPIPENLPQYLVDGLKLMSNHDALVNIHLPGNDRLLAEAKYRLKFEELFYLQLKAQRAYKRNKGFVGNVFNTIGDIFNTFYSKHLPFPLTGAQKRVIKEIYNDCRSGKQMNRLLQGDVGSGKTLVATMCMLIALDNGYQACLMVPTEILANQHFETIYQQLSPLGINVALLTGSTKQATRKKLLPMLASGEINIVIGTHALLEDSVKFKRLGLAIIDEQHRFGVAQRAKLQAKNALPPHVLVMTATPIPRTLAMTMYGDLEVSTIDEMPPGRKPIMTYHQFDTNKYQVYDFLKREIAKGRQVYIVYPLIDENEKLDYQSLMSGYEQLLHVFPKPQYNISMVHGRMKAAEKDSQMQDFASGRSQILVATTVIEVGVNVPNASVMLIESAERFGLSQLHQLRGRVGRGADQSYCVLMTDTEISKTIQTRMDIMVGSTNGFDIAEWDLRLRGEGDIEGTQQSGTALKMKIADLSTDTQILHRAHDAAVKIIEADPELNAPANAILFEELEERAKAEENWGNIS